MSAWRKAMHPKEEKHFQSEGRHRSPIPLLSLDHQQCTLSPRSEYEVCRSLSLNSLLRTYKENIINKNIKKKYNKA